MAAPKTRQMPIAKPIFLQIITCSLAPRGGTPQVRISACSHTQCASNEIKYKKICLWETEVIPFKYCPHFSLFRSHTKTCLFEEESAFSCHQPNLLIKRNRMVYKTLYLLSIFIYFPQFPKNTHFVSILQCENLKKIQN